MAVKKTAKKGRDTYNKWTFQSYIDNLKNKNYASININTFHQSLTKFIRETPNPVPFLSSLEETAIQFEKALKQVDRRKIAYRDDFISSSLRVYSFLNRKEKVKNLIESVENDEIDNIHKDYVLTKMYKYAREGENYCRTNKRWFRALREYQKSGKGKIYTKNIKSSTTKRKSRKKKSFFEKLFEFLGL